MQTHPCSSASVGPFRKQNWFRACSSARREGQTSCQFEGRSFHPSFQVGRTHGTRGGRALAKTQFARQSTARVSRRTLQPRAWCPSAGNSRASRTRNRARKFWLTLRPHGSPHYLRLQVTAFPDGRLCDCGNKAWLEGSRGGRNRFSWKSREFC